MTMTEPPRRATPLRMIAAADAPKAWVRQRTGYDCAVVAMAMTASADTATMRPPCSA